MSLSRGRQSISDDVYGGDGGDGGVMLTDG